VANTFNELAFSPTIREIIVSRPDEFITVLTGSNNSGKSAYLKKSISDRSFLYVGVNRFYSFHHLTPYSENTHEIDQWFNQQQNVAEQKFQNFEGSFFNCATAVTRLSNERRRLLFETFRELFGVVVEVKAEDPDNDFSNRFVSVGGESLSITSSGTRLFLGILAALMDDRFLVVAIDEPELGLSPTLQRKLADIIIRGNRRDVLFPHKPKIIESTHSHQFLDRSRPENNFVVSKSGNLITASNCKNFTELHDIQFRLLGNDLSELFLPDAVVFVEGDTDKLYLEKILSLHLPQARIVIESCNSDIASRLNFWASSLGDMQISPYRTRTLIVYDKVKQAGIERICRRIGLPSQNIIEWSGNGIEYVYPLNVISEIYRKTGIAASDLSIDGDSVSYGGISYKKMELCKKIVDGMSGETKLPTEVETKFLHPLKNIIN